MLLVKPSAKVEYMPECPLVLIERAGRTCYKSEDKAEHGSDERFVSMLLKRGHESVLEHVSATVRVVCDRGVSHEIVRHRIASYSQESTRYCDYNDGGIAFVIPPWVNISPTVFNIIEDSPLVYDTMDAFWLMSMRDAAKSYEHLRKLGWRPEQARSVLPNSLKTEMVITMNFREWRHFFKLRLAPAAHPQMRELAWLILAELRVKVPVVFEEFVTKE